MDGKSQAIAVAGAIRMAAAPALTASGAYGAAASHYGTLDQGGNVMEWVEASFGTNAFRGGGWRSDELAMRASTLTTLSYDHLDQLGFRLGATIPEPATAGLFSVGALALTRLRRERSLTLTKTKLVEHFGAGKAMRTITPHQASEWRAKLVAAKLADATVKSHVGFAKTMFAEAARRKLVDVNPFAHLKGGTTVTANERYITPAEADAVVAALPSTECKLLFALARYAGLRSPSETHLLTWADVDFERVRLNVRSPKTEHQEGHERRTVPIVPKLRRICPQGDTGSDEAGGC